MDNEKILEALFRPVISTEETKPEDDECDIVCCDPDEYDDYGNEYEDEDEYEDDNYGYEPFQNSSRIETLRSLAGKLDEAADYLNDNDHGYTNNQYNYICEKMDEIKDNIAYILTEAESYRYLG